jgi:hypothetical protein
VTIKQPQTEAHKQLEKKETLNPNFIQQEAQMRLIDNRSNYYCSKENQPI